MWERRPRVSKQLSFRARTAAWVCAAVFSVAPTPQLSTAAAAIAPQLQLGAEDQAELARIEEYLNGIRTVQSSFSQHSSNGERAEGQLYLSRPGKLRVEYQPPVPILVVADGTFLVYYDRDLEQVSYIPLASTPASILLDEQISLSGGALTVTDFERADDQILVSLVRTDNPGEGSITLVFRKDPLALQQWSVTDAQDIVTVVSLVEPRFDVHLDRKLFVFEDPRARVRESP
jgi:outer membrane lipoprotein-sorting protein